MSNDNLDKFQKILKQVSQTEEELIATESIKIEKKDYNIEEILEMENKLFENSKDVHNKYSNSDDKTKEFYVGHRKRAKERFLTSPASSISDYDLLELMLFFAIPRADVKPIAKKIIDDFGSISNLFAANPMEFKKYSVSDNSIMFLIKIFKEVSERLIKQGIKKHKAMENLEEVAKYLKLSIGSSKVEIFKVLFFDIRYHFICDRAFGTGTVDEITVYIRDIVRYTIECGAKYVMLSHNHPSGVLQPSKEDLTLTDKITDALGMINIKVLDHIIVCSDEYYSFAKNGLL